MNLLMLLFRLPFMPIQGVIKVAEVIGDEAERELHNPAAVRRELESAAEAGRAGSMSDEQVAQAEREAVARLQPTQASGDRN